MYSRVQEIAQMQIANNDASTSQSGTLMMCPECDRFSDHRRAICRGESKHSRKVQNDYRRLWGLNPLPQLKTYHARQEIKAKEWTPDQPARGLGDVIAKVTHYTGIDRIVKAVAGGGCGCKRRQQKLN